MQTTRTFIAIPIESHAAGAISRVSDGISADVDRVRWTDPSHFHLTLKFLGDVDNCLLPEICNQVSAAAKQFTAFQLMLDQVGSFPIGKPAKVLWLGTSEGLTALRHWHTELEAALEKMDFPKDGKAFSPHLTIGRVAQASDQTKLQGALAKAHSRLPLAIQVDTLAIMSSHRDRGRIHYDRVASIPLQ